MRLTDRLLLVSKSIALAGVFLLACSCAVPGSYAADVAEKWQAASTTATSVTGNVTFTPSKIQFQNGQSLPLALAGHAADFKSMGDKVNATVYRVTAPADLKLKGGNHLCGNGSHTLPVTYIVVWIPEAVGDKPPRSMAAFSGKDQPKADDSPDSCGVYNYELEH